ncbi:MAG: Rne/Rng family ribonuclease [Gemmataceae bacterium]
MKKEMLINVLQPEECRIAILENGLLEELYVERTSHESYVGNIYKGRIVNIEPSIQAAFVDFGVGRNGFLHVSDVEPAYYKHLESRRFEGVRRGNGRDRFRGQGDAESGRGMVRERQASPPEDEDRLFDETLSEENTAPTEELNHSAPVPFVEETEQVEEESIQFGSGVLADPSEISLLGEPDLGDVEVRIHEDSQAEPSALEASPAEEAEKEEPRGRRRPRGGSRRRRGSSNRKAKNVEPASESSLNPEEEKVSDERSEKPKAKDEPGAKPRLMDSAERRTEEEDADNEAASSVADDDVFFPRSSPSESPEHSAHSETHESYRTEDRIPEDPVKRAEEPFFGREVQTDPEDVKSAIRQDTAADLESAEEVEQTEDAEEELVGTESSQEISDFERDLVEEPTGRERRDDRRPSFDEDLDEEPRRRPRQGDSRPGDSRRGRPQNGKRGFSRPGMGRPKPLIQDIFKRGQEVLVQVIKEGIGTKGPTLSTYISIAGRYLVLMPGLNRVGVSRKIVDDEQRRRLREIFNELQPPKGLGFIIRTAGIDKNKKELQNDLAYLSRLWQVVARRIRKVKAPAEIYQESDMITRTIRDIFTGDIDTILVDEPTAYEHAKEFLQIVMPRYANRIKLYDDPAPLFHKYKIEDEILRIQQRHVPLPNGGSIVIDQTEALVAIDVNSGNFRADNNAEETAYQMNLLAAKEIARQLRLRDLGGVIANDFIDMRDDKHRRNVERAMREAVKRDRARTKILRISQFGIIEMTRQRIRPSLKRSIYRECASCRGTGHVKTSESMSIEVMRMVQLAANKGHLRQINVKVTEEVANYLLNKKRKEIAKLEELGGIQVHVTGVTGAPPETLEFTCFDSNNNEVKLLPQPEEFRPRRR